MQNIAIMLAGYIISIFCVPLPRVCSGNAAGILGGVLLFIYTVYFQNMNAAVCRFAQKGAPQFALAVLICTLMLITIVYFTQLSIKMYIAQRRRPPTSLPCTVIVLGCRVKGTRPTRMLRRRLAAAYDYLRENPRAVCIVSGGQGADEQISEAQAMRDYLVELGLEPSRIFMEDSSRDTMQNLRFSLEIIKAADLPQTVAAATDSFHQYRAAMLGRRLGLSLYAVSAKTEPRYAPTYWVREWFAIVKYTFFSRG